MSSHEVKQQSLSDTRQIVEPASLEETEHEGVGKLFTECARLLDLLRGVTPESVAVMKDLNEVLTLARASIDLMNAQNALKSKIMYQDYELAKESFTGKVGLDADGRPIFAEGTAESLTNGAENIRNRIFTDQGRKVIAQEAERVANSLMVLLSRRALEIWLETDNREVSKQVIECHTVLERYKFDKSFKDGPMLSRVQLEIDKADKAKTIRGIEVSLLKLEQHRGWKEQGESWEVVCKALRELETAIAFAKSRHTLSGDEYSLNEVTRAIREIAVPAMVLQLQHDINEGVHAVSDHQNLIERLKKYAPEESSIFAFEAIVKKLYLESILRMYEQNIQRNILISEIGIALKAYPDLINDPRFMRFFRQFSGMDLSQYTITQK